MELLSNLNIQLYIAAYLVGGIPFGLVLAKIISGVNIMEHGSNSIGTTNVLRVLKEKDPKNANLVTRLTLFFDTTKAIWVMIAARVMDASENTLWSVLLIAVISHMYSPYLNFRGGKGVATTIGSIIFLAPAIGLAGAFVWAFVGKVIKISSLASLLGILTILLSSYVVYPESGITGIDSRAPLYILTFIIYYKHIPNIWRLIKGEEGKVTLKKDDDNS